MRPLLLMVMLEPLANGPVVRAAVAVLALPTVTPALTFTVKSIGQLGVPARLNRFTLLALAVMLITEGATVSV